MCSQFLYWSCCCPCPPQDQSHFFLFQNRETKHQPLLMGDRWISPAGTGARDSGKAVGVAGLQVTNSFSIPANSWTHPCGPSWKQSPGKRLDSTLIWWETPIGIVRPRGIILLLWITRGFGAFRDVCLRSSQAGCLMEVLLICSEFSIGFICFLDP